MSDRRVEWIRAQLDATEAALEEYRKHRETGQHLNFDDPFDSCRLCVETSRANPYSDQEFGRADIASKRAILEAYADADSKVASMPYPDGRDIGREEALEGAICLLAEGFRHRPGYAEACGE